MVFKNLPSVRDVFSNAQAGRAACGAAAVVTAALAGTLLAASQTAAADPAGPAATPTRAKLDPAVVPAGGMAGGHCPRGPGLCHHAHCRDGLCVPSCPVRPGQFGYYGTQWRRWPGQGVVQASAFDAATPALPPKSAVPRADEESPRRPADELPVPEPIGDSPPQSLPPQQPGAGANRGADAGSPSGWKRFMVRQPAAHATWNEPSAGAASPDIEIRLSSAVAGQDADGSARGR